MGRAEIALLFFLFFIATPALALDFDCDKKFDDYYFGGEYLYFTCTVTADAESYLIQSGLDHSAIVVVVQYDDGKRAIHPLPDDHYQSDKNGTSLQFSESRDVDRLEITVSGYVPVIEERLDNVSAIKVEADGDKILNAEIRVVNKQKFYSDFNTLKDEKCVDSDKLKKAKSLYEDGKYAEAEEIFDEIENAVKECHYAERSAELKLRIDTIRNNLLNATTDLLYVQYMLDKAENYDAVFKEWKNLTDERDRLESELDEAYKLVVDGKFDEAESKINLIDEDTSNLKAKAESLKNSIREKNDFNWILVMAGIGIAVAIALAVLIYRVRRRDMW